MSSLFQLSSFVIAALFLTISSSFSQRNQILVFSDVHIGSYWFTSDANKKAFGSFLELVGSPSYSPSVQSLVVNGDYIDQWLIDFREHVPNWIDVLNSSIYQKTDVRLYTDLMKKIEDAGIEIFFISGNHDMAMKQEFYEAVGLKGKVVQTLDVDNVHIEHGHLMEMGAAPDPGNLLPFGYFETRAMAYSGGWKHLHWGHDLDPYPCEFFSEMDLLNVLADNEFFYQVLLSYSLGDSSLEDAIFLKEYLKHEDSQIVDGCFYWDTIGCMNVTFGQVAQKFRSMIQRWIDVVGLKVANEMFQPQCGNYKYFIERSPKELFVMGHTHVAELKFFERVAGDLGKIVYVNSGSWTNYAPYFPVVRITKEKNEPATFVELLKFNPTSSKFDILNDSVVPATDIEVVASRLNVNRVRKGEDGARLGNARFRKLKLLLTTESRRKSSAPPEWHCDPYFYDSQDGCDCSCGAWDPDCGPFSETCSHFCEK